RRRTGTRRERRTSCASVDATSSARYRSTSWISARRRVRVSHSLGETNLMSAVILAVDDDESNLQLLRDVCENSGWAVETETDGGNGLSRARSVNPDVILLDIMMPGTGGLELLEALQADRDLKLVPVVFVTAVSDPRSEDRAFQLGAVDYVRKPF